MKPQDNCNSQIGGLTAQSEVSHSNETETRRPNPVQRQLNTQMPRLQQLNQYSIMLDLYHRNLIERFVLPTAAAAASATVAFMRTNSEIPTSSNLNPLASHQVDKKKKRRKRKRRRRKKGASVTKEEGQQL